MKYIITIKGVHKADGESEISELITTGSVSFYGNDYKIRYKETSEGLEDCYVILSCEGGNKVTMTRTGGFSAELIMEKNKRHVCVYQTPVGNLSLGVYTDKVLSAVTENGGILSFSYSIDANGSFISENTLEVSLKKAKEGQTE